MKASKYARIFLFSALIGSTLGESPLLAGQSGDDAVLRGLRSAPAQARKAKSLLDRQSPDAAVAAAESAVASDPRNADYRLLLGRAYLAAGRFGAAAQSFQDVIALGAGTGRVMLNLALCQVALGDHDGALNWLERARDTIPAADYGLGLALAGQTDAAISVLEATSQNEQAGPRERQNLALSYAMAGQWRQARAVVAQDISADKVNTRLMEWAAFVSPHNSWDQVSALLRVKAHLDTGQLSELALGRFPDPVSVDVAEADLPIIAPVSAEPVTGEPVLASIDQALNDSAEPYYSAGEAVPVDMNAVPAVPAFQPAIVMHPIPGRLATKGRFVVQLGAYATRANAQVAWGKALARHGVLSSASSLLTRVAQRQVYRVAAGAFATRASAEALCSAIRRNHGSCFVRALDGDMPVQWTAKARASRTQIASR